MADNEKAWILDSLFEFLTGPIWNCPILVFIEEKSVIFDPEDQNDVEFKKVHRQYKDRVDFMLSSYIQDMEISVEDFHAACEQVTISPLLAENVKKTLYEQLWAADDYEAFKRMMTEKNIDLQLQALEVIRQKYGKGTLAPSAPQEDKDVLQTASDRLSAAAHDEPIAMALASSDYEAKRLTALRPVRAPIRGDGAPEPPSIPTYDASEQPADDDSEEIEKRQAYLKEQRDKLIALKKEVREGKLLQEAKKSRRPRTAKAAQDAISGHADQGDIDPQTLEVRKALADKLRQQLLGDSDL